MSYRFLNESPNPIYFTCNDITTRFNAHITDFLPRCSPFSAVLTGWIQSRPSTQDNTMDSLLLGVR